MDKEAWDQIEGKWLPEPLRKQVELLQKLKEGMESQNRESSKRLAQAKMVRNRLKDG